MSGTSSRHQTPQTLGVALVQMRYDSAETVASRIERASDLVGAAENADVVVLPELWAHGGFSYRHWTQTAETIDGAIFTAMASAARRNRTWLHAGSIIEREAGDKVRPRLWNTSAVFDPSGIRRARYRKIHRFGFGEGEPLMLTAGDQPEWFDLASRRGTAGRVGLSTCYDLRFPELYRELVDHDVEINLVTAAWPRARVGHWQALGRARAIENQSVVVQCNLVGEDEGVVLGGHSQIVDASGSVIATTSGHEEAVVVADVDLAEVRRLRAEFPVLADRRRAAAS